MRTTAPCYEYGTAIERIWHAVFSIYQHKVLIHRTLGKSPQNSLICERERAWWIFSSIEPTFWLCFFTNRGICGVCNVECGVRESLPLAARCRGILYDVLLSVAKNARSSRNAPRMAGIDKTMPLQLSCIYLAPFPLLGQKMP